MKKGCKKRYYFLVGIALALLAFVVIEMHSSNGDLVSVPAKLYVNGDPLEMPAYLYWYSKDSIGKNPPRFVFPFEEVLKQLGCQIEQDDQDKSRYAVVRVGNREFVLTGGSFACDLTKDDQVLVSGAARRQHVRGHGFTGPLYMADVDYEKVLKTLGFSQISLEIDESARIVKLSATP
ncbi:MAG: hypothetical protein IJS79_01525 [Oscillospiraceae bacterium]|nr:hypothetical protein [Oscillospiraceae bacterium]